MQYVAEGTYMQYVAVAKDTVNNLIELVYTDSLYGLKNVFEYKLI